MNFWIVKSEPTTYSIQDLRKDKSTVWDGIRNYQARNFLRQMTKGDSVIFYHSGDEKDVVGLASVCTPPYPDPKTKEDWTNVDLKFERAFSKPLKLSEMKSDPVLSKMIFLKQSRLSVGRLTQEQFDRILSLTVG